MNLQTATTELICAHRSEIAAYIDGELLPREELNLEMHFAACIECSRELNEHKKLLCVLDFALENEREIQLPSNFTKVVVTNAESQVSGLRRPQERTNSLFVCAALFLLVLLGLGNETENVLGTFGKFAEQIFAVGGFVLHLVYDISVGTAIILRSLSFQLVFGSAVSAIFVIALVFVGLYAVSRFIVRSN